ncbi:MAG: PDZ domain-containing protein [Nitrospirae bacterium]|nr:PDZ domain-containing protein [Candidatus Manganitrophaceae bacterium]
MRRLLFLFLIGWLAVEAPPAGWLGITIQELTPQIATRLGIRVSEGVFVASVQSGSPADKGGLRAGDVIVALNGQKITSPEALRQAVSKLNPGTSLEMTLFRGRQEKKIEISVGTPPRDAT